MLISPIETEIASGLIAVLRSQAFDKHRYKYLCIDFVQENTEFFSLKTR